MHEGAPSASNSEAEQNTVSEFEYGVKLNVEEMVAAIEQEQSIAQAAIDEANASINEAQGRENSDFLMKMAKFTAAMERFNTDFPKFVLNSLKGKK